MRRVITGLIAIALVACFFFSKYNIANIKTRYAQLESALDSFQVTRGSIESTRDALVSAQNIFDRSRTSDIYYGDMDRLLTVLDNIATITVSSWEPYSAEDGFVPVPSSGDKFTAARISLIVEDVDMALGVIDKLELPIYSINITEPNVVDVIFLTGAGIE